ncbi:hypothetical protein GCM10009823_19860 [Brevibacterium salitolerans]|uniref:DUF1850 domain-containing protein n=1 Tax=Brevibacterium salitolerans TaxID=1403566 RepID=A0ABN2WT17_9MICO
MGLAVLAAGAAAAAFAPVWPAVTVSGGERTLAVVGHDRFSISYVHSIDGLPIEEDLQVDEGRLVVERTRLRQFGAGMGQIEGHGHGRQEGRWWVIDDMGRDIGAEMHLRAGAPEVDHRLRIDTTELALSACMPGERITITAQRVSALRLLKAADAECALS